MVDEQVPFQPPSRSRWREGPSCQQSRSWSLRQPLSPRGGCRGLTLEQKSKLVITCPRSSCLLPSLGQCEDSSRPPPQAPHQEKSSLRVNAS